MHDNDYRDCAYRATASLKGKYIVDAFDFLTRSTSRKVREKRDWSREFKMYARVYDREIYERTINDRFVEFHEDRSIFKMPTVPNFFIDTHSR